MSLLPVAVYGRKVPAGDVMIPALLDFPATFRITMAAIDPSATPEYTGTTNGDTPARATLKIIYDPSGPSDDEDSDDDDDDAEDSLIRDLLNRQGSGEDDEDDESSSDDEEVNGGPSDPSKTKKARKEAAAQQMLKALEEANQEDSEDEMDVDKPSGANGVLKSMPKPKSNKGKGKDLAEDEDLDEDDEGSLPEDLDEQVICTLDPEKNYQQPLDITIPEDQRVFFKVSGTHAVYLTGNYVIPADKGHNYGGKLYDSDEEDEYDMSPDDEELDSDEESDDLDALEDPRITELASEEEGDEAPKLVKKSETVGKGKNKRVRDDSSDVGDVIPSLDDIMAKSLKPAEPATNGATNGEPKLSKKQLKKQKKNDGKAADMAVESKGPKKEDTTVKDTTALKTDKKVQFAKNLEQGPAASPSIASKSETVDNVKPEKKKEDGKPKGSLGVKIVQGVKIDDKKLGSGAAAKKGNKVFMRYIGKLTDGKVFDANKKGKPFSFTIGDGSVIKGWDIGVEGMTAGGERRVTIPGDLAYGKKGMPGIPPNAELIFDLKLLEIK